MNDQNAQQLLAKIMGWNDSDTVMKYVFTLQLLADYKYDHYQRFAPGMRFIESLALWLEQFDQVDRQTALDLVMNRLIYISDKEFSHLVQTAYPDLVVQERMRLVAEEQDIPPHRVGQIRKNRRFKELQLKSLYLGLSDGARTNEFRRGSDGAISNEQIWQAYELGSEKIDDMVKELGTSLSNAGVPFDDPKFNLVWLLDDFSGSGNTYIRYDGGNKAFKGKIKKIYDQLHRGDLIDTSHHEVYLLLYVATRQAVDHIEYWAERFTSEYGYKPLQVRVLCTLEHEVAITRNPDAQLDALIRNSKYYDNRASDQHTRVGGTNDLRFGFARCALPVVLSHNTPNNSLYILWGAESYDFRGLFPRVSRHREF